MLNLALLFDYRTRQGQTVIAVTVFIIAILAYFFIFKSTSSKDLSALNRSVSVEVAWAEQRDIAFIFEGVGSLSANESINVTAKESGVVEKIHFKDGQTVKSGQLLLSLDTNELRSELEVAQAQRDQAQLVAERAERLIVSGNISQEQADTLRIQLRAANARVSVASARLKEAMIHAPFAGEVGLRKVSPGALISPGIVITTLDDIETMKLDFTVPEVYIAGLKLGMSLTASTAAYKQNKFEGEITAIDTRLDSLTRSIKVQAKLKNKEKLLKPGLFMNVLLSLDKREQAIVIREQALISKGLKQFVYVVRDSKAQMQEIEIGFRQPGFVEVITGIKVGEAVVIAGIQKLRPDAAVAVLNSKTMTESAATSK